MVNTHRGMGTKVPSGHHLLIEVAMNFFIITITITVAIAVTISKLLYYTVAILC